ncbi:hypothetical protein QJQ45_008825 [Haematococcus lacustris]|nr:hypothetical protein QJQ45_008825 [Haematococcus lacustris]
MDSGTCGKKGGKHTDDVTARRVLACLVPPELLEQQLVSAFAQHSGLGRHWVSEAAQQNLEQRASIQDRADSLRHFAAVTAPDNRGHQGISQAVFDYIRHYYHEHSKPSPSCKDQRSYWVCQTAGDDERTLVNETRRFFESSLLVMWLEFDDEQQHLEEQWRQNQHLQGGQLQQPPSMRKRDDKHWDDECLTLLCSFAPDSVKQLCTLGKKLSVKMLNEYCKAVRLHVPAGTLRADLRGLASLLCHPQLALQLQQLDLPNTVIKEPKEPGPDAAALSNLFQHAKLTQLSFDDCQHGLLLDLQPLAQHLTQLCVGHNYDNLPAVAFISAVGALPQLQVLTASCGHHADLEGLPQLLQALPRLHTLNLPGATVQGQGQLVELLAATQLTSVSVEGFEHLEQPCAALVLGNLLVGHPSVSIPEVSAAVRNLTQACKVPVKIWELHSIKLLAISNMWEVSVEDFVVVAPLCQGCTALHFDQCGLSPSLEFWRQLVQLMPTVSSVSFAGCTGVDTEAMCESLVLMAELPWAPYLDILIHILNYNRCIRYQLPECCSSRFEQVSCKQVHFEQVNCRFDHNPASPAVFRLRFCVWG